jgi:hypothetical protein
MLIRTLSFAALLALAALPANALTPVLAPIQAPDSLSTEELMAVTGLDEVFTQFGATIAASPTEQGIPVQPEFLRAWQATAVEVFDPATLKGDLTGLLEGKFSVEELDQFATFFHSDFGRRITALERAVAIMPPEDQLAARDAGAALIEDLVKGSVRDKALDEVMELVSAEITRVMVGQSVRGMLIGMSAAGQTGDIEVPWEEIEAQLAEIMPSMDAEIEATQRAIMAFAYQPLSEDEMESYLKFLRTDAAKKFYAIAGVSVGRIVTDSMSRFGQALAQRLKQVNV